MAKRFRQTKDCLLQFDPKELDDFMDFLWNHKRLIRGFKEEYKNIYECEDTEGYIWIYPNCEPWNSRELALPREHDFVDCIYVTVKPDFEDTNKFLNIYKQDKLECVLTDDGLSWYDNKGNLVIDSCDSDIIWWRKN